ncbi:endonuclease III [Candidatus Uhrbacteria bacterium]|nr:endonuclease III [Candidatus Uhrbacteria bacterium]
MDTDSIMLQKRKRAARMLRVLKRLFPNANGTELIYETPWQLLVSVILSAQCTDKKVNEVTAKLFKKYPDLKDYIRLKQSVLQRIIYSTGFYRMKAKNILAAALVIKDTFDCMIPRTLSEMLSIPGVARKTANVVLGNLYGIAEGVVVDTHVMRLSKLLGLTAHSNPSKIEQDLMLIIPKKDWFQFSNLLVLYGRYICTARRHDHSKCLLSLI